MRSREENSTGVDEARKDETQERVSFIECIVWMMRGEGVLARRLSFHRNPILLWSRPSRSKTKSSKLRRRTMKREDAARKVMQF